jgi:NADH-quinone oxidoreductase subunit J
MAVVLLGQLVWTLSRIEMLREGVGESHPGASSVRLLGRVLFTDYMFAFEVTSILIIAAMVGAVVLAGKKGH